VRASTLIGMRRRMGRWIQCSQPPERDFSFRPPDPPPPEQMTLPGLESRTGLSDETLTPISASPTPTVS